MKLRSMAATVAVGAVLAGAAMPALASEHEASDDTNVTVSGGTLNVSNLSVGDFAGVTLDGTAKSTNATPGFSATDARGTGAGWNLTIQATQFAEHDGGDYVVDGRTLPLESLSLAQLMVTADGTDSPPPSVSSAAAVDAATASQIANAAVDEGMGKYDFSGANAFTLAIPASAYATTYRSDVTITVATGP